MNKGKSYVFLPPVPHDKTVIIHNGNIHNVVWIKEASHRDPGFLMSRSVTLLWHAHLASSHLDVAKTLLNRTIHAHLECKLAAELTLLPTCTPGSCAGSTVEGSATSSDLGTLLRHRAGGGVSANITMFKNVVMIFNIGRASVRERLS